LDAFCDCSLNQRGHARLVVGVRAGPGQVYLPDRETGGDGLLVEQRLAIAVDGDAAELLVDSGDESNNLVLLLAAENLEGPGAVFAAAPA
jgi:hypothetical protein